MWDSVPSAVCQHHFCYHKRELQGGQWRVLKLYKWHKLYHAEFILRGGSRISQGKKPKLKGTGVPTYFLVKFPPKLHENEENWIGRREASKICLCRSATDSHRFFAIIQNAWRISPGSKNSQSLIL